MDPFGIYVLLFFVVQFLDRWEYLGFLEFPHIFARATEVCAPIFSCKLFVAAGLYCSATSGRFGTMIS